MVQINNLKGESKKFFFIRSGDGRCERKQTNKPEQGK